MQEKPYFCPNCRSNRVKFNVISSYSQKFQKDAISGAVDELGELTPIEQGEPNIQCQVCGFISNELRFIKQAEREPRQAISTSSSYT